MEFRSFFKGPAPGILLWNGPWNSHPADDLRGADDGGMFMAAAIFS
jgi:hypothetical protein